MICFTLRLYIFPLQLAVRQGQETVLRIGDHWQKGGDSMEATSIQEILNALKLHSSHIDQKIDQLNDHLEKRIDEVRDQMNLRMDQLDNRMDQLESRLDHMEFTMEERFDRMEKKFDGMRVEIIETQETVDYLSTKNIQHEKKLRKIRI